MMVERRIFIFVISILLIFLIAGCQEALKEPESILPTMTSISTVQSSSQPSTQTAETDLVKETKTSPPVLQTTPEQGLERFDCQEVFCQAEWRGFLNRPISDSFRNTIDMTYPYASTMNHTLEVHHGVEFVNSSGTPVLAAQEGVVVFSGTDTESLFGPYLGFYGNVIIIQHPGLFFGEDIYTLYAHLSEINVAMGDAVSSGEIIGKVGASGSAIGSHLHFEVRLGSNDYDHTVNPILWFAPLFSNGQPDRAMVAGIIRNANGDPVNDLPLVLEKFNEGGTVEASYYLQSYVPEGMSTYPDLEENFVYPDLPAGEYRLAFVYGRVYEFFITLEPGSLGYLQIQL